MGELIIKCPHCSVPMAKQEGSIRKCQLCGLEIETDEWGSDEASAEVVTERIKEAIEEANNILQSPMDRKIKISVSIGGEWAKRFTALQALTTAIEVKNENVIVSVVKRGIASMWSNFMNIYQFREFADQAVKHGSISKETADALFRDMTRFGKENADDNWNIRED